MRETVFELPVSRVKLPRRLMPHGLVHTYPAKCTSPGADYAMNGIRPGNPPRPDGLHSNGPAHKMVLSSILDNLGIDLGPPLGVILDPQVVPNSLNSEEV